MQRSRCRCRCEPVSGEALERRISRARAEGGAALGRPASRPPEAGGRSSRGDDRDAASLCQSSQRGDGASAARQASRQVGAEAALDLRVPCDAQAARPPGARREHRRGAPRASCRRGRDGRRGRRAQGHRQHHQQRGRRPQGGGGRGPGASVPAGQGQPQVCSNAGDHEHAAGVAAPGGQSPWRGFQARPERPSNDTWRSRHTHTHLRRRLWGKVFEKAQGAAFDAAGLTSFLWASTAAGAISGAAPVSSS